MLTMACDAIVSELQGLNFYGATVARLLFGAIELQSSWCSTMPNICQVYFAFLCKIFTETILPFVEHDCLKWSCHVTSTMYKRACLDEHVSLKP